MADISSGPQVAFRGFATGLDSAAIIDALVNVRRVDQQRLQAKVAKIQKQQGAYGVLRTKLSALRSKADAINSIAKLGAATTSSTDTASATASATGAAGEGTYDLIVTRLASTGSQASTGFADKDVTKVGSGVIKIASGGVNVNVTIPAAATLQEVRNAINASDAAVNASIVDDGTPGSQFKLVLTAKTSGAAADFTIDDSAFTFSGGGSFAFEPLADALDAQFSVNGLPVTRASNTATDVIEGVTFNLKKGGGATTTVTVTRDLDAVKKKINDFVSAYSDVASEVKVHKSFADRDGKGTLFGDSNVSRILGKLRDASTAAVTGTNSVNDRLSDVGIRTDENGKLVVDDERLTAALEEDYEGVIALFTKSGSGPGAGIARAVAETVGATITGIILPRTNSLSGQTASLNKRVTELESRLTKYTEQLRQKYATLETFAGRYQAAGAALGTIGQN